MKNKIVLFSVLAVFALFAVIAVPSVSATYPANAIYLEPEDSGGLYCENDTLVEVRVNASVVTTGVQTSICFDPSCVNITDVDLTGGAWPPMVPPGWTHWGDHVTLIGTNFAGLPAGDNLFATIRLHCVNEGGCVSELEFRNVIVLDSAVTPIDITAYLGTFTCEIPEKPDLVVGKSVEFNEEGKFIVSYTVTNIGGSEAGESTTCKYVNDQEMEREHCPALGPGESHSDAFEPEDCPCGQTLKVTVCADNDDVVDESDETNNCDVNFVDCPPGKPDLIVEKSVQVPGDGTFIVWYSVKNRGGGPAGESRTCKYVDGVLQETQLCPPLALGAQHSATFEPEPCPCGETLNVTVCADNDDEVDESDEENNCEVNFVDCPPCPPKPDLIVDKSVEVGDDYFIVSYTVTNIGGSEAGESTTCKYVDGELQETQPCPALARHEQHSGTFEPEPCPCGEALNVTICADNYDEVDESDETNNCVRNWVYCLPCPPKPDLVVEKWVEVGDDDFIVSYLVKNMGDAPAGESTTCKYLNGVLQETQLCPALAPGVTHGGSFELEECPCGETLNVTVCADNENVVNESNEENNCEVNFVDCPPCKPDLIVEKSVEVGPDNFVVSYTVTNIGDGPAGESRTCKYVDGVLEETQPCPALVPDASHSGAFEPEDCPCGETLNVTICADNYDEVDESDETNNCDVNFVDCPPGIPGIEVNKTVWNGTAWVEETTAQISEIVRFRCEMHNNGTCCPLTNLVVTDTLSESLKYADNAAVHFPDCTTVHMEPIGCGHIWKWEFPDLVLLPCETLTIEFDAHVIDYGHDCNVQNATAICDDTGDAVFDEDTACVDVPKLPDLNVTEITVNYDAPSLKGIAIGPEPGPGVHTECNNLSAVIKENNGVDVESPFDVTFKVDGTTLCTVRVPGLTGGANKTVYCNCSWYPMAGDVFAIDVTADSNHEISETNETNNTNWNNGTVVSNGYKGDGWQGPDKNLINEQCHDQDTINLIYSVGDSEYVSGSTLWTDYTGSWTTTDLPVPDGAEIEKAMLYVYYTWDKNDVMPDNVNMAFNGNNIGLARHYSDRKGFGGYNYPSGMLIYDVLNNFAATGTNNAVLTKAVAADVVSMRGMLLMVVYKHPDEPERIIYIDEGYDMLYAKDSYAVSSEEATTYAPFTRCEPVPVEELVKATLIAVAPSAKDGDDMNRLSFNDGLWNGIWDHYEANTQLGIAVADVFAYLKAAENRANFQSHIPAGGDKGDFMDASNAFLILEKRPKPDLTVTEITVNYDASSLGGRAIGPVPGPDVHTECNNLSAVIAEENGVDVGSPFDVTFELDGTTLCTVLVPGLTGGANKTVYCNCSWYPMAGDVFAINVTADSNHEIPETDETNNTKWNNGTAVSNGFKGDGWQGPDKNLINVQCHPQDTNNLIYSVGDSYYAGGTWGETTNYVANWTTSDLPVPEDADIQKAWLYVYYCYDKNEIMPNGVSLTFNGDGISFVREYSDRKGFGTYNYPYGMLVYDVTTAFIATGNRAVLTKPAPDTYIPIRGMLLMVVYNHLDEPERIICIDEGYDMLYAKDSYAVTSEEATTYAPFTCCEPVPVEEIGKATLIAVAPSASDGDDTNRLSFNDGLWPGAWSCYAGATQLGIAEANVLAYLKPADNRANFQSHIPAGGNKGDFMEASNAFLILEKKGEIPCPAKYAVYQANVRDPEEPLNKLRALRDQKLDDGYVTSYYDNSPALTLVLSRADSDLVKEGAQLLSRYSIPVGQYVHGMDVDERITKQDVEEALSFTDRLKREVMKNGDAIGAKSTEAIIDFIDEFEGQVKASEGKTFSSALKSSIYYEGEPLRVDQEIVEK